jgi:hypothetical protein
VPSSQSPAPRDEHDEEPIGTSQLQVTRPAPASPERAAEVLGPGRAAWLGELVESREGEGAGRYLVDLELRVSDATPRVAFRKAAYLDVGALAADGERLSLEVSWRAAGLTPLFPVFAGRLGWREETLELDGYYAPPGGGVGVIADRLLLNVAARATARRLLDRIAEAMAAAA